MMRMREGTRRSCLKRKVFGNVTKWWPQLTHCGIFGKPVLIKECSFSFFQRCHIVQHRPTRCYFAIICISRPYFGSLTWDKKSLLTYYVLQSVLKWSSEKATPLWCHRRAHLHNTDASLKSGSTPSASPLFFAALFLCNPKGENCISSNCRKNVNIFHW